MSLARGGDICGANRVTVHRRVIEARDIARRANLLGQDSSQRVQERHALDPERLDGLEDDTQGVVGTNHLIGKNTRLGPR